jgi:ribosomal protein S10
MVTEDIDINKVHKALKQDINISKEKNKFQLLSTDLDLNIFKNDPKTMVKKYHVEIDSEMESISKVSHIINLSNVAYVFTQHKWYNDVTLKTKVKGAKNRMATFHIKIKGFDKSEVARVSNIIALRAKKYEEIKREKKLRPQLLEIKDEAGRKITIPHQAFPEKPFQALDGYFEYGGTKIKIKGPVSLPTTIEKFTTLKSPHVNKKARSQYEERTYHRLIVLEGQRESILNVMKEVVLQKSLPVVYSITEKENDG